MRIVFPGIMAKPGSSIANKTGSWRTGKRPNFLRESCTACDTCALICPEGCISGEGKNTYGPNLDYCKGCGLCAAVCPVQDIAMVEEGGR